MCSCQRSSKASFNGAAPLSGFVRTDANSHSSSLVTVSTIPGTPLTANFPSHHDALGFDSLSMENTPTDFHPLTSLPSPWRGPRPASALPEPPLLAAVGVPETV